MNDYKCKSISWNASGAEIEAESFRRIEAEIAPEVRCRFSPGEWRVVRRLIHTTADFAIADVVGFKNDPVSAGLSALRNGAGIYSDSNMIKAGLSVSKLSSFNSTYCRDSIICPSLTAQVGELARQRHITRALAGVELYLDKIDNGIFLCGNAPLALAGVAEAVLAGRIKPRLIIAMPVGFVNVVESKELALQLNDVPMIILNGRRGGSPLAVAALHGIMESGVAVKELRDGFTTGSAAAAAILAGYRYLTGGEILPQEELILPGGVVLNIPVKTLPDGWFAVQKDAGDDPDVTDKCIVKVKVVRGGAAGAGDLVEDCGRGKLIIHGGSGVGRVTRPGLAVAPGYPAINPGPRRIIKDNLMRMGFGEMDEVLTLEIAVENGEELARKTLNPALGIVGGISILGNSGIVKPYSHAAYVDTIKLQCRAALAAGKIPGFASGRRSGDALKRDFPMVEPIVSGDFIGEAVAAAVEAGAQEIIVGCMPGKLFKYACGLKNTHAHINPADMEQLRVFARQAGCDLPGNITTLGEAAALMPEELYQSMLSIICRKADTVLNEWGGKMNVVVAVYNEIGERLPL